MTPRAVLDTNVIVSGLGWSGAPARVLDAALDGRITLISSPQLLAELRRVLRYPKLAGKIDNSDALADLIEASSIVVIPGRVLAVVNDESDNRVLETAVEGNVDHIVSGDPDLLSLTSFEGVPIEAPHEFLAHLSPTD